MAFLTSCSTFHQSEIENIEYSKIIKEIQTLYLNKIPEEDFILLHSTNLMLNAFYSLKENKFENAKRISETILYTGNLIPSLYKFAYKAYSISTILSINSNTNKNNILKNLDFYSFQSSHCISLCDSIGWQVLAKDDAYLFTPSGYNEIILSSDLFSAIGHEKPNWINNIIFYENQPKSLKVSYDKIVNSSFTYVQNNKEKNKNFQDDKFQILFGENENNFKKIALSFFLRGDFKKAIELFLKIVDETDDPDLKSFSYYWIARSYTAENNLIDANKYYLMSGIESPLSLYDALSGQMVKSSSGRTSTKELSPFKGSWDDEMEKWMSYPDIKRSNSSLISTLKAVFLLSAQIKIKNKITRIDNYQRFILNNNDISVLLLQEEINWLAKKWEKQYQDWPKNERADLIGNKIIWLNYLVGKYLQSIILVSKIKETLNPYSNDNNFLYFLFYPKFYIDEIKNAILVCNVDPDIMYAIFRQEGFQINAKYENNISNKVCNFKKNLDKYKNNIVIALSAYKAGIVKTDLWLKNNFKINDDSIFMEYIPDNHIKDFVQETMKNYYNFKWIYFKKDLNG